MAIRIIKEPSAAAISLCIYETDGNIVSVYDLGGGTFDKSFNGNIFLVGEEFDIKLKQFLIGKIKKQYGIDNLKEKLAQHRIGKLSKNYRL